MAEMEASHGMTGPFKGQKSILGVQFDFKLYAQAKVHGLDFAAIAARMKIKPGPAAVPKLFRANHEWLSQPVATRPGLRSISAPFAWLAPALLAVIRGDLVVEGLSADAQLVLGLLPAHHQPPANGSSNLCLAFIGRGISSKQLLRAPLTIEGAKVVACDTVQQELEADVRQSKAGWAMLTFRHHQDAVRALHKRLYSKAAGYSAEFSWAKCGGVCALDSGGVSECPAALERRSLLQSLTEAKRGLHRQHVEELAIIMALYVEARRRTRAASPSLEEGAGQEESSGLVGSSYLWLKGLSRTASTDQKVVESAFEQWGVQEVQLLMDPVLGEPSGHALVRLREPEQVKWVSADLCRRVYPLGGTPRLVTSSVAQPGMLPLCRQDTYDAALCQVLGRDDHSRVEGRNLTLVTLPAHDFKPQH
ncbi:hypothetical protein WJX73_009140 [Symbiochloris irregularis]|uniref:RRM domain-containing protein n=1 Tax=Symbiochloris irregularis TaxID=706552 RepID=A0AAW1PI65_9CHLO